MKNFSERFKGNLSEFSKTLKNSSEEVLQKMKEGGEKIGAVGEYSTNKAAKVVNDVIKVLPLLEEAGFQSNNFTIHLGLSPILEISFIKIKNLEIEEIEAIKELHQSKKMFSLILTLLLTADNIKNKIEADVFSFQNIIIDLSLSPKVSLHYLREK